MRFYIENLPDTINHNGKTYTFFKFDNMFGYKLGLGFNIDDLLIGFRDEECSLKDLFIWCVNNGFIE